MINVEITISAELLSAIDGHCEDLGKIEICNVGGSRTMGNYEVKLYSRGDKPRVVRTGHIKNWPRLARPAMHLIMKAVLTVCDER